MILKNIAGRILATIVTLVVIDVAAYFWLPRSLGVMLDGYRSGAEHAPPALGGAARGYRVNHSSRGFDLAPNKRAVQAVDGNLFDIWTNSLGCFDREWSEPMPSYVYFAGDSFTWGHAEFDSKFPTKFEALTGIPSVKCGVGNTGQIHQFEKFREIVQGLARMPDRVVVAMYANDVVDDHAHPHTTIVRGHLASTVWVDEDGKLALASPDWINEHAARVIERREAQEARSALAAGTVKETLKRKSFLLGMIRVALTQRSVPAPQTLVVTPQGQIVGKPLYTLYEAQIRGGFLSYRSTDLSNRHKDVVRAWKTHAKNNRYDLYFVLIPPPEHYSNTGFYREVREYLDELQIPHNDLTMRFFEGGWSARDLYWPHDIHLSNYGNQVVGTLLAKALGKN